MSLVELLSLFGGIGLFLYGMSIMSTGLKNAAGDNLQKILEHATKNRVRAVLCGLGMTVLIQSSSATDVMVIGFVNSGLMTLAQAIGVIMGANIGTTVTAQIAAFSLGDYTPFLIFAGAIMFLFMKRSFPKHVGTVIMGFGMLFQGITMIKAAIAPLSQSQTFVDMITTLSNPFLAILFGIAFTALLQSSSSSIVIFQAFATQALIGYDTAVYLVIGAAIGSVTPNLLASLTANRNGKRTAVLNLIFNLIRAALLVTIINVIPLTRWICQLSGDSIARQIANTHTIFAVIAVLIELPIASLIIKLAEKIVPVLPEETEHEEERELNYMVNLDKMPPNIAVHQAQREITRMGNIARDNLKRALECFFEYDAEKAHTVRVKEETVNLLNHSISRAMVQFKSLALNSENMRRVSAMTISITDIERLSDHAENIVEYAEQMQTKKATLSDEAMNELKAMAKDTIDAVCLSLDIFHGEDYSLLDKIEALEASVDNYEKTLINNHIERLLKSNCNPVSGVIFSDIVTDLERCSDHAINIAYALKERPAELDQPHEV